MQITDVDVCNFLVELDLHRENMHLRGSNRDLWEVKTQNPYVVVVKKIAASDALAISGPCFTMLKYHASSR